MIMPKSRTDPKRKDKLNQFKKTKKKKMAQQVPQIPEIRQVPVWKSHTNIEMNGLEFEAIYNFINNVQAAYGAVQSIMNKNVINGNVVLNFEKLNAEKTDYVPMSEEEQAPHKAEFDKVLQAAKAQAAQMVRREDEHLEPENDQDNLPRIDSLVDQHGQAISS